MANQNQPGVGGSAASPFSYWLTDPSNPNLGQAPAQRRQPPGPATGNATEPVAATNPAATTTRTEGTAQTLPRGGLPAVENDGGFAVADPTPVARPAGLPTSANPARAMTASNGGATPPPLPQQSATFNMEAQAQQADQVARSKQQQFDLHQGHESVPYRFSKSNDFELDYQLHAVGADGIEKVELYGSLDSGRTWKLWGADPDKASPFDVVTKGEGTFSFRVVPVRTSGLASPSPMPGDRPDFSVIVDQTNPKIRITSARFGDGVDAGSLIIGYECKDEHLTKRPISLAFSDSLEGPWTTIAAGVRNDGLYIWQADPRLPAQLYLRIDAVDQAGNQSTYLLDQPVQTVGLAPRATILGIRPR